MRHFCAIGALTSGCMAALLRVVVREVWCHRTFGLVPITSRHWWRGVDKVFHESLKFDGAWAISVAKEL